MRIKLDFQVATTERLGDFLASGKAQVIHFSCHGQKQSLALEDGKGCADIVTPNALKRLFDAGQKKLQFVVVAACHSESTGQAFIDAGIPHVLCCEKDSKLMNKAAVKFSRHLYQSLASGRTLSESFELAKETVRLDPLIRNPEAEVEKYLLLPENGNHDVQVFFPRQVTSSASPRPSASRLFPHLYLPPSHGDLSGREKDIFKVLQKLSPLGKLIKIRGEDWLWSS